MGRLSDFRRGLTEVASYGYLPVPLVYTQVRDNIQGFFSCHMYYFRWFTWRSMSSLLWVWWENSGSSGSRRVMRRLISTILSLWLSGNYCLILLVQQKLIFFFFLPIFLIYNDYPYNFCQFLFQSTIQSYKSALDRNRLKSDRNLSIMPNHQVLVW